MTQLDRLSDHEWEELKAAEDRRRRDAAYPAWTREAVDHLIELLVPPSLEAKVGDGRRCAAMAWIADNLALGGGD